MPKKKKRKKQNPPKRTNGARNSRDTASAGQENSEDNSGGVLEYSEAPTDQTSAVVKTSESAPQVPKATETESGGSPAGFLKGAKDELDKVVWPDRQQLISESAAVILMVSFSAVLISLADNIFKAVSQLVF